MAIGAILKNSGKKKFDKTGNDAMYLDPGEEDIYLRTEGVPDTELVLSDGTILS